MGVENLSEGNGKNDASFIKNMFCDKVRTFIFQRFCGCNKKQICYSILPYRNSMSSSIGTALMHGSFKWAKC